MEDDNHHNYIDVSSTEDDEDDGGNDDDDDDRAHINGNQEDLEVEEGEEDDDEYTSDASTNESVGIYGGSSRQGTSDSNSDIIRNNKSSKLFKSNIKGKQRNLILKLFNREYSGNPQSTHGYMQPFIETVPKGLSFCLKDIVPTACLLGHVFMGLSSCGQFLFSYKICCNDNLLLPIFSLTPTYKYRLFFWIYQPHKKIRLFHHCCLFDDHSVDSLKDVTMIQWRCSDPRILIIHGAARDRNEDSYITFVKVPKLGCRDCKKLRDADNDEFLLHPLTLCLKCNLTVHTKYSRSESDIKFDPYIQMICPERILIVSNGFLHMLHICINQAPTATMNTTSTTQQQSHSQQQQQQQQHQSQQTILEASQIINSSNYYDGNGDDVIVGINGSNNNRPLLIENYHKNIENEALSINDSLQQHDDHCDNDNNIISRIIEDFTDIESTESINQHSGCVTITHDNSICNSSNSNNNVTYAQTQLSRPSLLKKSSSDDLIENCHKFNNNNNNNKKQNFNTSRNYGNDCNGGNNNATSIISPGVSIISNHYNYNNNNNNGNNKNTNNNYNYNKMNPKTAASTFLTATSYTTTATITTTTAAAAAAAAAAVATTAVSMITTPTPTPTRTPVQRQRHRIVTKPFRRRGIYTYFSNTISTNAKGNNKNDDTVTSYSAISGTTAASASASVSASASSTNNYKYNYNVSDTKTTATISGSSYNNNNNSSSSSGSGTGSGSSNAGATTDKASAYEFHEDNEKCEKISILRKRRLADRKYEFSDDNSENIKPFTIKRSTSTFLSPAHTSCSSFGGGGGLNNIAANNGNPTNHRAQSPRSSFTYNFYGNNSPFNSPSTSPHSNMSRYRTVTPTMPAVAAATPTQLSPNSFGGCSPLNFRSPPPSSSSTGSINNNNNNNNSVLATTIVSANNYSNNNNCSSSSSSPISMRSPNRHLIANHIYNNNHNNNNNNNNNCHTSCSAAAQYMLSFKTITPAATTNTMLSPLHLSTMTKRSFDGTLAPTGSISPTTFLSSPRRDGSINGGIGEWRTVEIPIQGAAMTEKPLCMKKFQRLFVEEDDAASVITSEGDDCISPGYHTLLPLEVHGSCYSEMQMISKASYQRLHCTSVLIDQHTFDLEMFTYYVIATLCQKHEESFDYIIDWAYEIINICPVSSTVFCILIAHFECRHKNNSPHWNSFIKMMRMMPSLVTLNRRQYECRVLFCWNMVTGEWEVLDFGELCETDITTTDNVNGGDGVDAVKANGNGNSNGNDYYLSLRAKRLANDMLQSLKNILPDYTSNLRVLDSNIRKSKDSITDLDNLIEFRLRRA